MKKAEIVTMVIVVAIIVILVGFAAYNLGFSQGVGDILPSAVQNKSFGTGAGYGSVPANGTLGGSGRIIDIKPQSLGNLPQGSMSGSLTPEEIERITGARFDPSVKGVRIDALNMSQTVYFKKIGFVIDQSFDKNDRRVYRAENVDVQRFNTFGVNSRDQYIFEKMGEFYVIKDAKGNITFVAHGAVSNLGQTRVQSFSNVPWANLSGSLTLDEAARNFTYPYLQSVDRSYSPKKDILDQLRNINLTDAEERGWLRAERGIIRQMVYVKDGKTYWAENVEISPGDYPGGITPSGDSPPFLLITIRAGRPEEKIYFLVFCDEEKNAVSVGQTDVLPSTSSSSGGLGRGTTSFSSSPGGSNPGGGQPATGGSRGPVGGVGA